MVNLKGGNFIYEMSILFKVCLINGSKNAYLSDFLKLTDGNES